MKYEIKFAYEDDAQLVPEERVIQVRVKELDHSIVILAGGQVLCRLFKANAPVQALSYFNSRSCESNGFRKGHPEQGI